MLLPIHSVHRFDHLALQFLLFPCNKPTIPRAELTISMEIFVIIFRLDTIYDRFVVSHSSQPFYRLIACTSLFAVHAPLLLNDWDFLLLISLLCKTINVCNHYYNWSENHWKCFEFFFFFLDFCQFEAKVADCKKITILLLLYSYHYLISRVLDIVYSSSSFYGRNKRI